MVRQRSAVFTTATALLPLLPLLLLLLLLVATANVRALDNGAAPLPPMGWSSWDAFHLAVNTTVLKSMADLMVSTGLRDAGYVYLLLDDGWPKCEQVLPNGHCGVPTPRGPDQRIVIDPVKFPNGLKEVSDYCHAKGLKFGIYTAPHHTTCGGYTASLGYEKVDAQAFADWGIDYVKLDAGCREDCGLHDGCLLGSLTAMRDGLNATGRKMVYYIDDGNPTSGPRVYNPHLRHVAPITVHHQALQWNEFVDHWGPSTANLWKLWFDRQDTWESLLDNVHQQINMHWFQQPNAFNNPDFLTVGLGGMSAGQYRAELALYAALGAPLILSFDLTTIAQRPETLALVTNRELLAIDQDPDCVQGSLARLRESHEMWIRPLHDGSFAVAIVNKAPANGAGAGAGGGGAANVTVSLADDFYPAEFLSCTVRDVLRHADLGRFTGLFSVVVPPLDAVLLLVTPIPN